MAADHPFIFAPGSFVRFRVQVQVFVDQLRESFFSAQRRSLRVALADRVFAAGDFGLVLERFRAGFEDTEVRKLTKRIATGAAVDPSFQHEAFRAIAGYLKRKTGNLVVAQEKLAAFGGRVFSTRFLMRCAMQTPCRHYAQKSQG